MASIIILLGGPGAGKGTQAVRLAEKRSLPHVSTGDLFRAHLKEGTAFGRKAKQYMEAGQLVPDGVVLDMLSARVTADDCRDGYLLDGFPRTLPQARALDERLNGEDELRVFSLVVSDATIVERIAGRRVCRSCGGVHHVKSLPARVKGICDACGGELHQRKDDTAEVVEERLRVYHEETEPLERFYADKGVLTTIDGEQGPDAVFALLDKELVE